MMHHNVSISSRLWAIVGDIVITRYSSLAQESLTRAQKGFGYEPFRSQEETTAFLVEAKQAGIFFIEHFPEDQHKQLLGSYCPNILFPFAREIIAELVTKGGFPQLLLNPVNFDALYQQHLNAVKEQQENPEQIKH